MDPSHPSPKRACVRMPFKFLFDGHVRLLLRVCSYPNGATGRTPRRGCSQLGAVCAQQGRLECSAGFRSYSLHTLVPMKTAESNTVYSPSSLLLFFSSEYLRFCPYK